MKRLQKIFAYGYIVAICFVGLKFILNLYLGDQNNPPVMATWLLLAFGVLFSWMMYSETKECNRISNIANYFDAGILWILVFAIIFLSKETNTAMSFLDRFNFGVLAGVFSAWCCFHHPLVPQSIAPRFCVGACVDYQFVHRGMNGMMQILLVLAYFPLLERLWQASPTGESLQVWGVMLVGNMFALASALIARDRVAILYAARAVMLISLVVALMLLIKPSLYL